MLVRLVYASRSTQEVNTQMLDSILTESRKHNPTSGITGILCYSGNLFVQVLEGNRHAVSRLYNLIVKDARHQDVEILAFEEITERKFSHWTMGQVNLNKTNLATLLKYSEKAEFNPFSVSGKMSLALLDELIATAAILGRN